MEKIKVSIIIPFYNGERYVEKLIEAIRSQDFHEKIEIIGLVSKSKDKTFEKVSEYCDIICEINNFNHGSTRHQGAMMANGEILVFITQDILPYDKKWLTNLIAPLGNADIIASFSRQIPYEDSSAIERHIREFNYPDVPRICSKENRMINKRKNFFYSDSSSACLKRDYLELDGYNIETETNEDVIFAHKIIENNKKYRYSPESRVYHSHNSSLRELYKRYEAIGKFESKYNYIFSEYKSEAEGKKLLIYLIKRLITNLNVTDILALPFNIGTRYLGYKKGKRKVNS